MNNQQSLREYLSSFRTVVEKRKVFFAVFREMHRFHNNGEYLLNLSFDTIYLCFTNPNDVHFTKYEKIGKQSIDMVLNLKMQNILSLVQMMICAFLEYDFNNPLICMEVLKEEFEKLRPYFYQDDYLYLKKVLIDNDYLYYDDYICKLDNKDFKSFNEKRTISESEEAFTNALLLTINLVVVFLIFSCLMLYLF